MVGTKEWFGKQEIMASESAWTKPQRDWEMQTESLYRTGRIGQMSVWSG